MTYQGLRLIAAAGAVAIGLGSLSPTAHATLIVSGSVGGAPTGVHHLNFDDLALGSGGGTTVGPNGTAVVSFTPDGQAVQGSSSGLYAAPFLSGNNGVGFGSPDQPNGADTTTYLTSGGISTASVTVNFGHPELYVGLLWGSVDSFNTLSFYNGATLVGSVTGSDVVASPNGDQGQNGTLYVNINSTLAFDRIVATSSIHAFEFDNVAYNETPINTPEPSTVVISLVAGSFLGLYTIRKRRAAG
jgi:hypothetical protein